MRSINNIFARSEGLRKTIAVTVAEDAGILEAVRQAKARGIADPILIGDTQKIRHLANRIGLSLHESELQKAGSPGESVRIGVELILCGRASILMKGLVNTRDFLKVVLHKTHGLEVSGLLSHVALFFTDFYTKPLLVTDAGMNLFPSFDDKLVIARHGIEVLHRLGISRPGVAVLAHNEIPSDKVPASVDALRLVEAGQGGVLPECIIEGPLSLDLALQRKSCEQKRFQTRIGGQADMLLCPDILSGNILYKSMTVIGNASGAAFIAGASVPIILTSRSDMTHTKLLSIAFAAAVC